MKKFKLIIAVLSFTILGASACGGSDPGIPITDGDTDSGEHEFDFEVIPEYDVEWESLPESRCGSLTHNNDVVISATVGGTAAYCLPGDPLDGSSLLLEAGALSADARLMFSAAADFDFAPGVVSAGPAIKISASAINGSAAVRLFKASVLTLPLYRGLLSSGSASQMLIYYSIDGKTGVLDFNPTAQAEDGDIDGEAGEDVFWEEDITYLIDSRNELLSLPVRSFGIFQVAMPDTGARRK